MTNRWTAPKADEIEISVFGPGRGECAVVHVPGPPSTWFVVDSLLARVEGVRAPIAQLYLDRVGVGAIWAVLLTHWHADHTAGAASLISTYRNSLALVGLPPAFGRRELGSFMVTRLIESATAGEVADLAAVMTELARPESQRIEQVLLGNRTSLAPPGSTWALDAIAPSVADVQLQLDTLAARVGIGTPTDSTYDVNACCAVFVLEVGAVRVLLGSDLDAGRSPAHGWEAAERVNEFETVVMRNLCGESCREHAA